MPGPTSTLAPSNDLSDTGRFAHDLAGDDTEHQLRQAQREADPFRAAQLRDEVVVAHRSFALALAHRFEHRGVEREDLEQVALLGLVHAVRRYRPGTGPGFTAFATPTITGEIKRYFRDHGWGVRPPRSLQELHLDVRTGSESLVQELGRQPTVEEIAHRTGRTVEEVQRARSLQGAYRWSSLDAPLGGQEGLTLGDTVSEDETDYLLVEDRASLRPLLDSLSPRDRLILRLRFVDELTQREIGARIGVSQMQVSRLLTDLLRRLRQGLSEDSSP